MKLSELDPVLKGSVEQGQLHFDCPVCGGSGGAGHTVLVYISSAPYHEEAPEPPRTKPKKVWQASGTFPDTLTLAPSINIVDDILDTDGKKIGEKTMCWHGHIQNGEVT